MSSMIPLSVLHRKTPSSAGYTPMFSHKPTSKRRIIILTSVVLLIFLYCAHSFYVVTYPAQLIPPSEYYSILKSSEDIFPWKMKQDIEHALSSRTSLANSYIPSSSPHDYESGYNSTSLIPNRVWQTDKNPPLQSDSRTWEKNGFDREFLSDEGALDWVVSTFGESEITRVYRGLPKPILKADMLRYLVLLAEGGVYSDADTRALMPLANWADDSDVFISPSSDPESLSPIDSAAPSGPAGYKQRRQSIRMIVSIEGDFHIWRDKVAFAEGAGITKTGRHRAFQIVQWTMASTPFHPILVDAVRRIVETATLARAWEITHLRKQQALEASGESKKAKEVKGEKRPWDEDEKGDLLSIQEWTGPAVWTDCVLSYLLATAGIREKDLYSLTKPIQIGDVLVLPMDGFNPMRSSLPNPMARVIHLFRGSWKDPWPLGLHQLTEPSK